MRIGLAATLLLLACIACPQGDGTTAQSQFLTQKPDITILVTEHPTGAEDVVINTVKPNYPPELLRDQIQKLGQLLGTETRWAGPIQQSGQPDAKYFKAIVAVNGLIDRQQGVYRLQPIAQAFAGAPAPHTIENISVTFAKEVGGKNDLATYEIPNVLKLEAIRFFNPDMLEYRMRLLSQDASKLVIPEKHAPSPQGSTPAKNEPSNVLFYVLVAVAGLALSVLVYLALLRFRPRTGS